VTGRRLAAVGGHGQLTSLPNQTKLHDLVRIVAMRRCLLALFLPLLLGACLSFSSSNPPPPHNTTIVVPPGTTVVCPNGSQPPC
jgi:hypothetical protein